MKKPGFNVFFLMSAAVLAVFSCSKPDIVEPDDKDEKPDVEVEATDSTAKEDTAVTPVLPAVPEGTFQLRLSVDGSKTSNDGWGTGWTPGDAVNVFTIPGGRHDDAERWTNHGKFTFDHTTNDTFVGNLSADLDEGQRYLWHVVYPYTVAFTDPSGLEEPHEDQIVTIGHLPGSYLTQNGNDSKEHLCGPAFPLYDAATTTGSQVPEFEMHQMAAVIALNVTNGTAAPLTVTDVKFAHSSEALTGTFAVDFGWVTGGFASTSLFRVPQSASAESVLKVVNASPIPVGGSAKFYLPIMPNKFAAGSEWTITVNDFKKPSQLSVEEEICSGKIKTFNFTVVDPTTLELSLPADNQQVDLTATSEVGFAWKPVAGAEGYTILFSTSSDMSDYAKINVSDATVSVKSEILDYAMHELGFDFGQTCKVYWTVVLKGDERINTSARPLGVKRLVQAPYEDRVAEPLTIPVAILVEDPVYNGRIEAYRGKSITEIIHKGWGYKWNDPYVQMKEFERDMEASSNGVVKYEVVKIVEADRLFSYHRNSLNSAEKHYLTVDTLVNYYFHNRPTSGDNTIDNAASYDYVGMMKHYGFDKMTDNGEIKEVWVYTHPTSGMNESRLIGKGAFWCNSMGIDVPEASNTELCCVMFCNYERTTDLAMHSYAHRVESIMSQAYERKGGFDGWNYKTKDNVEELTNWEKYSAHSLEYKKYKEGYAHIGCCHFPPNSVEDYDYGNMSYVMTYADTWYDYPYIREDDSVARRINRSEWTDDGGWQWGYMKWYFGHLPHFKGICPRDGHLNNWWHYIVDYNEAIRLEEQQKSPL